MQPFKPAADADWFVEGLAEFYSLELQRRAGLLDARAFERGLRLFERFLRMHIDERPNTGIVPLDLVQTGLGQLDGGETLIQEMAQFFDRCCGDLHTFHVICNGESPGAFQ
jgi:hypothetical protein